MAMSNSDRGRKHVCPACETKYYDLRKKVVACPRCGAKAPVAKLRQAVQPARKSGAAAFRRFP